jgi:hypothetical protein
VRHPHRAQGELGVQDVRACLPACLSAGS